jgi:hypothetical protein
MTWSIAPDKGQKFQYFRHMPNSRSKNISGKNYVAVVGPENVGSYSHIDAAGAPDWPRQSELAGGPQIVARAARKREAQLPT